jgi:hypothetical protein
MICHAKECDTEPDIYDYTEMATDDDMSQSGEGTRVFSFENLLQTLAIC